MSTPPLCVAFWALWAACTGNPDSQDAGADPTDPPGSGANDPTGSDGPIPGGCEVSAGLEVVGVSVADGRIATDRALVVELSEPASVAALCTAEDDPTEQHLVESDEATTHELRFQGLLPDTRYECRVAPLCPQMDAAPATVTVQTGAGEAFPVLEVEVDPELGMTGYWTLLSWVGGGGCADRPGWLLLYDGQGVARWWYRIPEGTWIDVEALYDPAEGTITWGGGQSPNGAPRIVDLWAGDVYVTTFPGSADLVFTHDGKRAPDGRILSLDERSFQGPQREYRGFGITLHDPETGEVAFDITSERYVDEGWLSAGGPPRDPYHPNWVGLAEHPRGDRVYVSLCEIWSIMSFDAASGDVRFLLGPGQGWNVRSPDGEPLGDRELPQCTHGNEIVGDDVLLVYDNAYERPRSRIVELAIDAEAHTVVLTEVWSEQGWKESTLGDVDVLAGGRILVTEAHPECWSESAGDRSAVVEVDRQSGRVASRLTFPRPEDTIYRSERYDGCALMSSVAACPALADRAAELSDLFGR